MLFRSAPLADLLATYSPVSLPYHLTHYVKGQTPLSTTPVVVSTLAGYLAVIFGIQALMRDRQPLKLQFLFQVHNVILSAGSLLLLVLMLEEIIPIGLKSGPFEMICGQEAWTSRMEFYYMINYAFKYLELIDTVFLALKKKPLQFLHVFHHSATALLCYNQLDGKTSIVCQLTFTTCHPAHRISVVDGHYIEPDGTCSHVLLLLCHCRGS